MPEAKKLLVLTIDVDDDLGEKAKVRGPVVGRQENVDAATKMALADPEEADANSIFQAVKEYDELSKEYDVQVAALTGHRGLGYKADREIVRQLEKVLDEFEADACVLVSDGASDDQVIPLIQSRVKINRVRQLVIKQTKELEKTYFVVLEKLKEPHYARLVFGVPAVGLLLYFLLPNEGPRIFIGLLGAYLFLKGLGVEEAIISSVSKVEFSFESPTFLLYFASVPLALVSVGIALDSVYRRGSLDALKGAALFVKFLLQLMPVALLFMVAGNAVEAWTDKKRYNLPNIIVDGLIIVFLSFILSSAADWVLGALSFPNFLYTLLLGVAAMLVATHFAREYKKKMVAEMKLEGKEVYTEIGGFLGKIVGVNKKNQLIVQTGRGQKIDFDFDNISRIGEKIIIRY